MSKWFVESSYFVDSELALIAFFLCLQRTPLHWAADGGHAEVISLLIDAGAQLEAKDRDNVRPSMGSDVGMSYTHAAAIRNSQSLATIPYEI